MSITKNKIIDFILSEIFEIDYDLKLCLNSYIHQCNQMAFNMFSGYFFYEKEEIVQTNT